MGRVPACAGMPAHFICAHGGLVRPPAFENGLVGVNAPIPQERPMGAGDIDLVQIHAGQENFLAIRGGFGEEFAGRSGDEAAAPEFESVAPHRFFMSNAVGGGHEAAIGNRVGALNSFPGGLLGSAVMLFFGRMPADGGGVEKDLGALERGQTGRFGVPLVPADQNAEGAESGFPGAKTEISGRKIKLFVKQRVLRDVHFAVDAQEGAVGVDDGGGVVIEAWGAFFEQGGNDDDTVFFGEGLKCLGAGSGDGFSKLELGVILRLAKVLGAKKLLGADDLSPLFGGFCGQIEGVAKVHIGIGVAHGLQERQRGLGVGSFVFRGHDQVDKRGSLKLREPIPAGMRALDMRRPGRHEQKRQMGAKRTVTRVWCAKKRGCQGAEMVKTAILLAKKHYFSCNDSLTRFNAH